MNVELLKEYKKQRKRIRDARSRLIRKGYEMPEIEEIIKTPNKINAATIRRLKNITPEKLRSQAKHKPTSEILKEEIKKQKQKEKIQKEKQKQKDKIKKNKKSTKKDKSKKSKKQGKKEKFKKSKKAPSKDSVDNLRDKFEREEKQEVPEDEELQYQFTGEDIIEALMREVRDISSFVQQETPIQKGSDSIAEERINQAIDEVGVKKAAKNIKDNWINIQEALFYVFNHTYDGVEFATGLERIYTYITGNKMSVNIAMSYSKDTPKEYNYYTANEISQNDLNLPIKDDNEMNENTKYWSENPIKDDNEMNENNKYWSENPIMHEYFNKREDVTEKVEAMADALMNKKIFGAKNKEDIIESDIDYLKNKNNKLQDQYSNQFEYNLNERDYHEYVDIFLDVADKINKGSEPDEAIAELAMEGVDNYNKIVDDNGEILSFDNLIDAIRKLNDINKKR